MALALALLADGEIVNADSRQIYRHLNEGTSKPSPEDRRKVPHHLYDFLDPDKTYSAGDYARAARSAIEDIQKRGKAAIVTGGTGLYVRALFEGIAELPGRDEALRKKFLDLAESRGRKALHEMLEKSDPVSAKKIPYQNIQRVVRALEVQALTDKPLSELHRSQKPRGPDLRALRFGIRWPREELRKRIRARTEAILPAVIAETEQLIERGFKPKDPGCQSLGYRRAFEYLGKKISRDVLFESLLIDTYQYAKRQETWFNRDPKVRWIDAGRSFDPNEAAQKIMQHIQTSSEED